MGILIIVELFNGNDYHYHWQSYFCYYILTNNFIYRWKNEKFTFSNFACLYIFKCSFCWHHNRNVEQEQRNQMAAAQGEQRKQSMQAQGEMQSRQMEENKVSTLLGMAQQRKGAADKARADATQAAVGGIGNIAMGAAGVGLGEDLPGLL